MRLACCVVLLGASLACSDDPVEPGGGEPPLVLPPPPAATESPHATALLPLCPDGLEQLNSSFAFGMSEGGDIAGHHQECSGANADQGFVWLSTGTALELGRGRPRDVNDAGLVVGAVPYSGHVEGGVWQGTTLHALPSPSGGRAFPYAVNSAGAIAGTDYGDPQDPRSARATLWTGPPNALEPRSLGTLGGESSQAFGINDHGSVVGTAKDSAGNDRAFLWTAAGGMRDLGTLGGTTSVAHGINDRGQVVGWSTDALGRSHGFVWTSTGGMRDLGAYENSEVRPRAISEAGVIVGSIVVSGKTQPVFWLPDGGVHNLGTVGGARGEAFDITDLCVVSGWSDNADGWERATRWALPDCPS